jgi:hypothetical protein
METKLRQNLPQLRRGRLAERNPNPLADNLGEIEQTRIAVFQKFQNFGGGQGAVLLPVRAAQAKGKNDFNRETGELREMRSASRSGSRGTEKQSGTAGGREIGELVLHLGAGGTAAQDAGGRLDFLGGKPMCHVGVAAFAALAALNFFLTGCAHKFMAKYATTRQTGQERNPRIYSGNSYLTGLCGLRYIHGAVGRAAVTRFAERKFTRLQFFLCISFTSTMPGRRETRTKNLLGSADLIGVGNLAQTSDC